jgi:hypothetical protein
MKERINLSEIPNEDIAEINTYLVNEMAGECTRLLSINWKKDGSVEARGECYGEPCVDVYTCYVDSDGTIIYQLSHTTDPR